MQGLPHGSDDGLQRSSPDDQHSRAACQMCCARHGAGPHLLMQLLQKQFSDSFRITADNGHFALYVLRDERVQRPAEEVTSKIERYDNNLKC